VGYLDELTRCAFALDKQNVDCDFGSNAVDNDSPTKFQLLSAATATNLSTISNQTAQNSDRSMLQRSQT
jgi:hypothetical protein